MHHFVWYFIKGEKIHIQPFNWFCLHLVSYSHTLCWKMIKKWYWFFNLVSYAPNEKYFQLVYVSFSILVSKILNWYYSLFGIKITYMFCLFSIGILNWYHDVSLYTFMLNWYIFQLVSFICTPLLIFCFWQKGGEHFFL